MISFDYSVVASSPERRGASNVGPWGSPSGVEDAVRSVTFCRTSHFAVIATALAGAAAMPIGAASASAQMNDGTLSGTFAAYGTVKVVASKVLAYDTNGLSVTGGFLNHMTWHCSGLADFRNGTGRAQGFCAGNDPVGDQVVFNWESEEHPPDQKVVSGAFNWTGGTGKYAGIRGGGTYVDYAGEFLPLAEETVVRYFKFEGNYKLPEAYSPRTEAANVPAQRWRISSGAQTSSRRAPMNNDFVEIRGQSLPRRMVLQGVASLLGCAFAPDALYAAAQSCALTTSDIIGPFYRFGAPFQTKLAGPNEPGERLIISGKVYSSDCRSHLPNTLIEVWQANSAGQYDTDKPGNFTEHVDFHLRGMMLTDQQGNYEFETIMPGRYAIPPNLPGLEKYAGAMRPAHIHFRVSEMLHAPLTTQLYFKGDPNIANDPWARSKPSMAIDLKQDGKFLHGNLDFVLDNSQAPPTSN